MELSTVEGRIGYSTERCMLGEAGSGKYNKLGLTKLYYIKNRPRVRFTVLHFFLQTFFLL